MPAFHEPPHSEGVRASGGTDPCILTSVLDGGEFLFHLADAFSDKEDAPKYPLR